MNERLQLRWMIAMLSHLRALPGQQLDSASFNNSATLLNDLTSELGIQERLFKEAIADGARQSEKDREK